MQAKQRREVHFKSSVGSMLNENYGYGYTQNTVQHGDFVHLTPNSLPVSDKAIDFLDKKFFPPSKPPRVSSSSSTPDLYQAYRNVTGQPVGMVHYDRDPFYWPGRERPPSDCEPAKRTSINCFDYLFNNGRDYTLPTPEDSNSTRNSVVSTPTTLKSKRGAQSTVSSGKGSQSSAGVLGVNPDGNQNKQQRLPSSSSDIPHDVRFLYLTENKLLDHDGFKAYSPFTDTSPDFDVKLGKQNYNHYKQPEEKAISTPIPAPKYSDALNRVLDVTSSEANRIAERSNRRPADILKLHGNPEYPSKVMVDKDVPNYVAWAKIYPYCPLTQKEGEEKPQYVPPRGFTPSTASRPPTHAKLRDLKKAKRNIMEGIKLLSGSSSRKRQQQLSKSKSILRDANAVNEQEKTNVAIQKQALLNNDTSNINAMRQPDDPSKDKALEKDLAATIEHINRSGSRLEELSSPTHQAYQSILYDPTATRKVLDLKIKSGGDAWYSGKTPTRTPSPDSRLPLPANRAWIKHYSPSRIRRFMTNAAKPNDQG